MAESLGIRNDSIRGTSPEASSENLGLVGGLGAKVQAFLSNLNFTFSKLAIEEPDDTTIEEYDTKFWDEEDCFNPWTKFLPKSEFEEYCYTQDIAVPYPKYDVPFQYFLFRKKLIPREKDLEDYPGNCFLRFEE